MGHLVTAIFMIFYVSVTAAWGVLLVQGATWLILN
jgi:hypothetical protein